MTRLVIELLRLRNVIAADRCLNFVELMQFQMGNADYLMFADIDYSHPEVVEETKKWGGKSPSHLIIILHVLQRKCVTHSQYSAAFTQSGSSMSSALMDFASTQLNILTLSS